jgi:hypothetical protein
MRVLAELAFIVVGAIGAAVCLAALARRLPRAAPLFEPALRARAEREVVPPPLVRLERVVESSASSALDAHGRLRPVLVEIAQERLARRGLRLDRDEAEARRRLGPAAWELVRPGRPPPWDRDAPGVAPAELEQILASLEGV